MAKTPPTKGKKPANARQAKIEAARSGAGAGANKIVVATVVVIVAIIAVVAGVILSTRGDDAPAAGGALPPGVSAMGEGFPAFSEVTPEPNAPTVDLYEDFQCPACAQFESLVGPTITGLAAEGRIKLVYHVKNFLDDNLGNGSSTRAGTAAFCAADTGRFQEFHDQVFPGQPAQEGQGFTDELLTEFATNAGIEGEALATWETCLTSGRYDAYVDSVEASSFEDGVRGTPTVRINGEEQDLNTIVSPEGFTQAVEAATE
ncbi:thioredoxin domain-containing protein [uncultured Phycicoccus sp.]|uniref:DsbA family protein n=1 Tax=uncultured Phycicoccus sp. TaxID=661422 RepID=UPI00262D9537|nr:thioredoxin domain-containing protein [uncultured Phycicoccus sp.]